jgi:hypothetical protein
MSKTKTPSPSLLPRGEGVDTRNGRTSDAKMTNDEAQITKLDLFSPQALTFVEDLGRPAS